MSHVELSASSVLEHLACGDPQSAWQEVHAETVAVVAVLKVPTPHSREDLVSETVLRTFQDEASALRRARPDVPLRAWLRGVAKNILREMCRRPPPGPVRHDPWRHVRGKSGPGTSVPAEFSRASLDLTILTRKQRAAVELRLAGHSWGSCAQKLGISNRSVRDRIGAALRRLRRAQGQVESAEVRHWAIRLLADEGRIPSAMPCGAVRLMLRLHGEGRSHADIAQMLQTTADVVRQRIGRLRRGYLGRPGSRRPRERNTRMPFTKNRRPSQ